MVVVAPDCWFPTCTPSRARELDSQTSAPEMRCAGVAVWQIQGSKSHISLVVTGSLVVSHLLVLGMLPLPGER